MNEVGALMIKAATKLLRQHEDISALRAELEELRAWKAQAIAVAPPMQEIGQELGIRWGDTIHDKILPGIQGLKAEVAALTADLADCDCWGDLSCRLWVKEKNFCPVCRARGKIEKEPSK